jgi:Glycosyl hydrolase family 26
MVKRIHGAMTWPDGKEKVSKATIESFNTAAGKNIGVAYFSAPPRPVGHKKFLLQFPLDLSNEVKAAGIQSNSIIVPFIRMVGFGDDWDNIGLDMKRIAKGDFDDQLTRWANDAISYGSKILAEFGVEINSGNKDFPWCKAKPKDFVSAYKHIIEIIRDKAGAKNIQWALHLAADSAHKYKDFWLGDDYIDWIGVSAYGQANHDNSEGKADGCIKKLESIYDHLIKLSDKARYGIFEWGMGEAWDIKKTLTTLSQGDKFPRIDLLQYWNEWDQHDPEEIDHRIDNPDRPDNKKFYNDGIKSDVFSSTFD